jgi:hypothetical protein
MDKKLFASASSPTKNLIWNSSFNKFIFFII